jgi:nucleotide-binding universal stress UspA family protein
MSFAQILAPLTGSSRDKPVLAGAFAAARLFNAHVVGLFIRPDPVEAMPFYGEGMSSAVVQEIMDVSKRAANDASRTARASLNSTAGECGASLVTSAERGDAVTASFREVEGTFADQVASGARLSDLVVFGALGENDRPGLGEAFETTLLETGRPVLLVSQMPAPNFADKIAVAWNGSTASAHAVSAALPFLKKASEVVVLVVKRGNADPMPTDDVQTYLRLHGIKADAKLVQGGERAVADALLAAASEGAAGLLVAGGYGHNRLRELFVTGTTRRVVAHASIPCFLVH